MILALAFSFNIIYSNNIAIKMLFFINFVAAVETMRKTGFCFFLMCTYNCNLYFSLMILRFT